MEKCRDNFRSFQKKNARKPGDETISTVKVRSLHGIVATAIFVTIFAWKEFTFAYIFTGTKTHTAPIVLDQMLSPVTGVTWGPLFAAATTQLLPILIFVWLVQSYLVEGLKTGAVKG